ncbi:MAG TPA: response regulator [Cyclobacteriaceae bacterium]|nr:response regulator [Cyclobacteriaceae bacterium]
MQVDVILIDRDPISIYLYQRALAQVDAAKYSLHKFTSGREALKHLENNRDEDRRYVILMDMKMGSISGREFLDLVRRAYPDKTQVIIISEADQKGEIDKTAGYEPVISCFEKPISMESLWEIGNLVCQMVRMTPG